MVGGKGDGAQAARDGKRRTLGGQLVDFDLVGQLRNDDAHRGYHALQPRGAVHAQGCGASLVSEGQKQTGQAAYMVGVVMRDQHVVDAFEAQVGAAHGGLRALAAVDQHGAAVGAHI